MRLTKITTRTGDDGTTGLADARASPRTARASAPSAAWMSSTATSGIARRATADNVRGELLRIQNDCSISAPSSLARCAVQRGEARRLDGAIAQYNTACLRSRNSSCPVARVPLRCATSRAVWRAAQNVTTCTC